MGARDETLEYILEFHHPDPGAWEPTIPDELPRWAAVETNGFGEEAWIAFCETRDDAIAYFFSGEGNWFPACVVDLDTGQAYSVKIGCEIGEEVTL